MEELESVRQKLVSEDLLSNEVLEDVGRKIDMGSAMTDSTDWRLTNQHEPKPDGRVPLSLSARRCAIEAIKGFGASFCAGGGPDRASTLPSNGPLNHGMQYRRST